MIERFKVPGNPGFQHKLNALADGHNIDSTIRGDETFINVDRSRGGLMIWLNWRALLARIPKFVPQVAQLFKVYAIPAIAYGYSPGYVIARTWNSNTSTVGLANYSIGVSIAHPIGRTLHAIPITAPGGDWLDRNGDDGKPLAWKETGVDYGTPFVTRCVQSGGSNGTWNSPPTWTYEIWTQDNVTQLTDAVAISLERRRNGTMTAAIHAWVQYNDAGDLILLDPIEREGSFNCNASSGSPTLTTISDSELSLLPDYDLDALPD